MPHYAVSVVCPFFNEEAIIEAATQRMVGNLDAQFGESWELILVDDGSRDASRQRLMALLDGMKRPNIRILSYDRNQGRGRALKTGLDHASAPIVVTTEADCSWGDDIVKRLYDELEAHPSAHFVVASPHREGGGLVNVSRNRMVLTKLGNVLIRMFFNSKVTMNTGMTRGYRRQVIQPLVVQENGKEFHLEVLLKLLTIGFECREIPATITWQDHRLARVGSEKRKSSTKIFKTIGTHLKFMAIAQPVKYFAALAGVSALLGMGFLLAAVLVLLTHAGPAIYLAMTGMLMLLFFLTFTGFAVMFHQFREAMRENWMRDYPQPWPPSVSAGRQVYPEV